MLYSALCNLTDNLKPYPTARAPKQQPISLAESALRRNAAAAQISERAGEQPEVVSGGRGTEARQTRSGRVYSRTAPLPAGALHLTCVLGSQVFLGRYAALSCSQLTCRPVHNVNLLVLGG